MKKLVLIGFIFLSFSLSSFAKSNGGALARTVFIGYGAGHLYLDDSHTDFFMLSEAGIQSVWFLGSYIPLILSFGYVDIAGYLTPLAITSFLVIRTCEVVDIFFAMYRSGKKEESLAEFSFQPLLVPQFSESAGNGFSPGINFKASF